MRTSTKTIVSGVIIVIIGLVLIGVLISATSKFFYILSKVDQNQVCKVSGKNLKSLALGL
jgi:hypothetical protein